MKNGVPNTIKNSMIGISHMCKRDSREYRIARAIHLRANPRCVCCGTIKGRAVHHLNGVKYFPDEICDPNNLVTLCDYRAKDSHSLFHNVFKRSTREKCTKDDFRRFATIMNFQFKNSIIHKYIDP